MLTKTTYKYEPHVANTNTPRTISFDIPTSSRLQHLSESVCACLIQDNMHTSPLSFIYVFWLTVNLKNSWTRIPLTSYISIQLLSTLPVSQ